MVFTSQSSTIARVILVRTEPPASTMLTCIRVSVWLVVQARTARQVGQSHFIFVNVM